MLPSGSGCRSPPSRPTTSGTPWSPHSRSCVGGEDQVLGENPSSRGGGSRHDANSFGDPCAERAEPGGGITRWCVEPPATPTTRMPVRWSASRAALPSAMVPTGPRTDRAAGSWTVSWSTMTGRAEVVYRPGCRTAIPPGPTRVASDGSGDTAVRWSGAADTLIQVPPASAPSRHGTSRPSARRHGRSRSSVRSPGTAG